MLTHNMCIKCTYIYITYTLVYIHIYISYMYVHIATYFIYYIVLFKMIS